MRLCKDRLITGMILFDVNKDIQYLHKPFYLNTLLYSFQHVSYLVIVVLGSVFKHTKKKLNGTWYSIFISFGFFIMFSSFLN